MSLYIGNQKIPNVTVRISQSGITNYQTKTISPSTSTQNIVADAGYDALSKVIINPIQTETKTVTSNGTVTPSSGKYLTSVTVNVPVGSTINNQDKTVTPTSSQQSITADSGYTGLGTVTVNKIPSNYIIPSGTLSVTSNGTKDVTNYASINVNIPTGSTINNQNKTVNPTESSQSISADSGYTGLGTVTVNAISKTYVGSEVTRQAAKTVTPSTSSQTAVASGVYTTGAITVAAIPSTYIVPSGNKSITANGTNIDVTAYATVSVNVPSGGTTINNQNKTVTPSTSQQTVSADSGYTGLGTVTVNAMPTGTTTSPTSISGTSASVSTGTNTLTLTKTISVTPRVTTAGYVSAGTAGNSSVSLTASVTTKAAATITPGTSNQTIASGTYLTGTQTIAGDSDLTAANIKTGVQIFGVNGTYTSDANATAANIESGKTAYVNGSKLTGTLNFVNIYTGTSAPSSSTGSNGDIYIQG